MTFWPLRHIKNDSDSTWTWRVLTRRLCLLWWSLVSAAADFILLTFIAAAPPSLTHALFALCFIEHGDSDFPLPQSSTPAPLPRRFVLQTASAAPLIKWSLRAQTHGSTKGRHRFGFRHPTYAAAAAAAASDFTIATTSQRPHRRARRPLTVCSCVYVARSCCLIIPDEGRVCDHLDLICGLCLESQSHL